MANSTSPADNASTPEASLQVEGLFRNHAPVKREGFRKTLRILWNVIFHKPHNTRPSAPVPVQPLTQAALMAAPNHSVYRLGHSTVLLKLRDKFWITDPVFAERASPVQWAGPKRFHQPPISLEQLPPIEAVILSHDHYDHLDQQAVLKLADKTKYFLTPLGVGDTLIKWGIDASKIRQLDWWQGTEVDGCLLYTSPSPRDS